MTAVRNILSILAPSPRKCFLLLFCHNYSNSKYEQYMPSLQDMINFIVRCTSGLPSGSKVHLDFGEGRQDSEVLGVEDCVKVPFISFKSAAPPTSEIKLNWKWHIWGRGPFNYDVRKILDTLNSCYSHTLTETCQHSLLLLGYLLPYPLWTSAGQF